MFSYDKDTSVNNIQFTIDRYISRTIKCTYMYSCNNTPPFNKDPLIITQAIETSLLVYDQQSLSNFHALFGSIFFA